MILCLSLACRVEHWASSPEEWARLMDGELPLGFKAYTTALSFSPVELPSTLAHMKMAALVADEPLTHAAVYASNELVGAPVEIGRRKIGQPVRGILVNNKISNVGVSSGERDALDVCRACADVVGGDLVPASTGVIGWGLPVEAMKEAATRFEAASCVDVAKAMMTTDRYPKIARATTESGATIVGFAKGAGMIEPELATMLVFLLTDADVDLGPRLAPIARQTFGCIGVDGDESTSDMVVGLASKRTPYSSDFDQKLGDVCAQLAHHLVRNGEGTNHVIRLTMRSKLDPELERRLGRAILNGPLMKCAIAGNDPNVGRIVARLGQVLGAERRRDPTLDSPLSSAIVKLGGCVIFQDGNFQLDADKEVSMRKHLADAQLGPSDIGFPGKSAGLNYPSHGNCVELHVDLAPDLPDDHPATVLLGSDLTHQYVTENGDYRS